MCGINGIAGLSDIHQAKSAIEQMNQAIAHRGPDDEGVFVNHHVALGHRRLAIIDLTESGHQPMFSYDSRFSIVFNGEIYNFNALKKQLAHYPYVTGTDTEVILAAYEKWGADCVHHFNGMFAFAIWDEHENRLFIARDRLGIKPLYYYHKENQLVFSSEVRALLKSQYVPAEINLDAVTDYLQYQTVHAPQTIVRDVYMLMPGHTMTVREGDISISRFWNITGEGTNQEEGRAAGQSYAEIKEHIYDLLFKSVERRLVADVPFGAFLSGGIDSSIIVGLMGRIIPGKVKTFSVTFQEEGFSEAAYSSMIAEKFNTDHTEINLSPEIFLDLLPEALHAMDHPSGDGPNTYVVSKATRQAGVTMALSGLGGDELFAGYPVFKRSSKLSQYQWLATIPKFVKSAISKSLELANLSVTSAKAAELLHKNSWDLIETYPVSRQVLFKKELKKLLNGKAKNHVNRVSDIVRLALQGHQELPLLSKVTVAEILTYLQNVLLRDTDQMSMASALEVRVPFLDHTLLEYILSVPDIYKYPSTPKKLLVEATGDLLPHEVVNRPKMGFVLPWEHWMRNELKRESEEKLKNLCDRSFIEGGEVSGMWQGFLEGKKSINWSRIWLLVVLEHWLELNKIDL